MRKDPDCEADGCQLLLHKGYHSCTLSGVCAWLDEDKDPPDMYPSENHRLDDPRHGQAEGINAQRHKAGRVDD